MKKLNPGQLISAAESILSRTSQKLEPLQKEYTEGIQDLIAIRHRAETPEIIERVTEKYLKIT